MKYEPRKVYVLESGSYQEITYQEHCRKRQSEDSYNNRYFIPLQGMLLEVSKEIYSELYREKERERYLRKLDRENGLLSIDAFEPAEESGIDFLPDMFTDMAESVMERLLLDRLRECISLLCSEEQKPIRQHYFDEISEVELSREYGITQQAVSKRLKKIREKLKNLLEQ